MTLRTALIINFLVCALALAVICWGQEPETSEADLRRDVALSIARWHSLTRQQAILLLAIEEHEKGGPGKEFGIESIPCEFKDGRKSYVVNCIRACEMIKRRCPVPDKEGVWKLGERWAEHRAWWKYVWRNMRKYKNIIY